MGCFGLPASPSTDYVDDLTKPTAADGLQHTHYPSTHQKEVEVLSPAEPPTPTPLSPIESTMVGYGNKQGPFKAYERLYAIPWGHVPASIPYKRR